MEHGQVDQRTAMMQRGTITHMWDRTVREDSRDRGARPCASSRAVMPKDHMSALESYWMPEMSSGAIQQG
jgi:hypothetical protein